jgi:hypothetical protein
MTAAGRLLTALTAALIALLVSYGLAPVTAATATTSAAPSTYDYDRGATSAEHASTSVPEAPGPDRAPVMKNVARRSANTRRAVTVFLAAEEEMAAVRGFQTYTKVLLAGEV